MDFNSTTTTPLKSPFKSPNRNQNPFHPEFESDNTVQSPTSIKSLLQSPLIPIQGNATKSKVQQVPSSSVPDSLLRRLAGPSDQKAGQSRDPAEVQAIILKHSKGSAFYDNEVRKDAELTVKVKTMLEKLEADIKRKGGDLQEEEDKVDQILIELRKERVLNEIIMVVDADAFYASCAELKDPSLIGTAFAVGEGVLTTASYAARKFGCRSAMPGFIAKQLCPHLHFVAVDFPWYSACSKNIMNILREYGVTSPASLDEAYVSITEYCVSSGLSPAEVGNQIRERIKLETGLTVSAGISPNASISKIAADLNKPNGQYVVAQTAVACQEFMANLACRKVSGIGRVGERWLSGLGIEKIKDIYTERGRLYLVRKEIGLTSLLRRYLGLGSTKIEVSERRDRKSCGFERTFQAISNPSEMYEQLKKAATSLEEDITKLKYSGRTVNLSLKLSTYERMTRSITIGPSTYSNSAEFMYQHAKSLLDTVIRERQNDFDSGIKVIGCGGKRDLSLRLLGIRMTNLRDDTLEKENRKGGLDSWTIKRVKKDEPEEPEFGFNAAEGKEPSSSDELWAQLPDLDEQEDSTSDLAENSERFKPFFTAGFSIDSKVEPKSSKIHAIAPKNQQLNFDSHKKFEKQELECPICEIIFLLNEVGMSAHVENCLKRMEELDEEKNKKEKRKKRKSESELEKLGSKKSKGKGLDAFFK